MLFYHLRILSLAQRDIKMFALLFFLLTPSIILLCLRFCSLMSTAMRSSCKSYVFYCNIHTLDLQILSYLCLYQRELLSKALCRCPCPYLIYTISFKNLQICMLLHFKPHSRPCIHALSKHKYLYSQKTFIQACMHTFTHIHKWTMILPVCHPCSASNINAFP